MPQRFLTIFVTLALGIVVQALPLPKILLSSPFPTPDKTVKRSLSDEPGKTLVIFLAGRKSYSAAYEQAVRLSRAWGNDQQVRAFVVADLAGVPGFVRGMAEESLLRSDAEANRRLPAGARIVTFLDWEGLFAKQLDVVGESNDHYLLYVVDRRGRIVERLTQKINDMTEERVFELTQAAVQEARLGSPAP